MPDTTDNFLLLGARVSWVKTTDGKKTMRYGTVVDYWPSDMLFVIDPEEPTHVGQQVFKTVSGVKVLEKPDLKVAAWDTNSVECRFYV
jgi:hypothetical protein